MHTSLVNALRQPPLPIATRGQGPHMETDGSFPEGSTPPRGRSMQRSARRAHSEQPRARRSPEVRLRSMTLGAKVTARPAAAFGGRHGDAVRLGAVSAAAAPRCRDPRAERDPRAHAQALQKALDALLSPPATPSATQSAAAVGIALVVGSVLKRASVWSLDALAHGDAPMRQQLGHAACTVAWAGYLPGLLSVMEAADTQTYRLYERIVSLLAAMAWAAARPRPKGSAFVEQAWLMIALSAHALPAMHQCVRYGVAVGLGIKADDARKPAAGLALSPAPSLKNFHLLHDCQPPGARC